MISTSHKKHLNILEQFIENGAVFNTAQNAFNINGADLLLLIGACNFLLIARTYVKLSLNNQIFDL